ncbi:MAG: hypothetical protein JXR66_11515 [Bacteroidales bacterium]|nr:hypothetical protein [Bacteroidales bacterium]MBN2634178.1 hypothetical protein [Bacteroidales bacterium]
MKRQLLSGIILSMVLSIPGLSQSGGVKQIRLTDFELQSSALISESGEELSMAGYEPEVYWFQVKVPCTVLTGLVKNDVYPDPYSGMNNMLIPDASDDFNKKYDLGRFSHLPQAPNPWKDPYWYRTTFMVPAADRGRHFQLIFKGINYRAAVWVNGRQIAFPEKMAGMFSEFSYDITEHIKTGELNGVAVKIFPLDYPGEPDDEQLKALGDFYLNGGPTGDIGKNVTMLCSVGWDWIPPVRDRNIGIWLPVYLRTSGPVSIASPKLVTELPNLPDTSLARISLGLKLVNHLNNNVKGILDVSISPYNFKGRTIKFRKEINLAGNSFSELQIEGSDTPELILRKPVLWWPNGHGNPALYRIRLSYSLPEGLSDDTTFLFGIRTVSSKAVEVNGSWRRDFYVNGRRIHLTGGAWVPDMMLNRDSARYEHEMRLCRNANINLVRIWGGGVTPCDEFWDAADRHGMLVWSDFWITGDTQGEFKGSPDWPLEGDIFKKCVVSTILRIRNHPSLLVWTGGNEGHARKELYDFMRNSIIELDGTRPFIPSSSGFAKLPEGWPASWPDNKPGGVYSGGPYTWQPPENYYKKVIAGRDWVFKDETGIPSMVTWNSLPKVIPNLVWDRQLPFPLNNTWGYHDAATGNGRWDLYYKETVKRYGETSTMEEFCDKMQLMNADGYRGIFEAAGHKLNETGGVMLWKMNAAFPSVVWQVYDWYLQPNAGYYFMQSACEPLHIQLNPVNHTVTVLNRKYEQASNLTAEVEIFDKESKSLFREEAWFSSGLSEVKELTQLNDFFERKQGISFVFLKLKDRSGKIISRNVYWLSGENDFRELDKLPQATLTVSPPKKKQKDNETEWSFKLTNNSPRIAFFIRPRLLAENEEVLPAFWSASYFSLAPGEDISITVSTPGNVIRDKDAEISVEGWNIDKITVR